MGIFIAPPPFAPESGVYVSLLGGDGLQPGACRVDFAFCHPLDLYLFFLQGGWASFAAASLSDGPIPKDAFSPPDWECIPGPVGGAPK